MMTGVGEDEPTKVESVERSPIHVKIERDASELVQNNKQEALKQRDGGYSEAEEEEAERVADIEFQKELHDDMFEYYNDLRNGAS